MLFVERRRVWEFKHMSRFQCDNILLFIKFKNYQILKKEKNRKSKENAFLLLLYNTLPWKTFAICTFFLFLLLLSLSLRISLIHNLISDEINALSVLWKQYWHIIKSFQFRDKRWKLLSRTFAFVFHKKNVCVCILKYIFSVFQSS